jgi:hypothetical protein
MCTKILSKSRLVAVLYNSLFEEIIHSFYKNDPNIFLKYKIFFNVVFLKRLDYLNMEYIIKSEIRQN